MKRTRSVRKVKSLGEDLEPEYRFDYTKAKPNRFAAGYKPGSRVVVLDPDVAEVFTTTESVNAVLRASCEYPSPVRKLVMHRTTRSVINKPRPGSEGYS
jgi:hypothetical protein